MVAESVAADDTAVTVVPAPVSPDPGAQTAILEGGREDLTVFFSIGIVVDVLLVTVFLVWAVRQWRKAGK
ncbi:MAG TPA: hypothetical protein ENJ80_12245 [Gammaproteobacteria bacterium]|nr:hypothetical protein [Gammaproteobacteria bacterium]